MRVSLYFLLVATLTACAKANEEPPFYGGRQLRPVDIDVDQETMSYLLPKLASKYRPNSDWTEVADPRFYLLTEMESSDGGNRQVSRNNVRNKRYYYERLRGSEPVLSVNAPLKALQKVYLAERMRQRLAQNQVMLRNLPDIQEGGLKRGDRY